MNRRAFTLVEMVITLSVFLLLAGMVFAILISVLQATTQLEDNRDRGDTASALRAFLRTQLQEPSGDDQMMSYHLDGNAADAGGLAYSVDGHWAALDTDPQPNGLYTLRAGRLPFSVAPNIQLFVRDVLGRDPHIAWIVLQRDVRMFNWRFLDFKATQWTDTWQNPLGRPNLAECTYESSGQLQASVMDLWIPNVRSMVLNLPTATSPNANSNP
jgi:prepilin-type N-terminal cleavage/methylation domain-containing protein